MSHTNEFDQPETQNSSKRSDADDTVGKPPIRGQLEQNRTGQEERQIAREKALSDPAEDEAAPPGPRRPRKPMPRKFSPTRLSP